MSASREIVAEVNSVPITKCKCRYCLMHSPWINDMLWCEAWNTGTRASDFCSFFIPGEDGEA